MQRHREQLIRQWFDMWLAGTDLGIDSIFAENCVYVESWGPRYDGTSAVKHWFSQWNTRGKVLVWDIKQFFHKEGQTAVEWYFKYAMDDGQSECFDGMTVIEWNHAGKIKYLKEFGCKLPNYNPYENGDTPLLKNKDMWI